MEPHMTVIKAAVVRFLVFIGLLGALSATTWAQPDDNLANEITYREFLGSLTPAERKIPINLVASARYADGQPLPASLGKFASLQAREAQPEPDVYRIDGVNREALLAALTAEGLSAKFVSDTRNYVTVLTTPSSVSALATYDAVLKISVVIGPTAQGQGSTQAAGAHRLAELYPVDAPDADDPALDGSGVVIGLISLPFKQADLDALEAEATRIIPDATALNVLTGSDAVAHDSGTLDAVDNTGGTLDALYVLQLIYDMAPGARVVVASPGGDGSTSGEMAIVVNALVKGNSDAGIPAANVIIDDLFYVDQNPFEVDEVSEAITTAREAGVLYITAAGDNGQGGSSPTSTVYLSGFDGIEAPAEVLEIDNQLDGYFVQSFGGDGMLNVTEDLDNLCVFWNERPSPAAVPRFIAWVYNGNDIVVDSMSVSAPGGCTGSAVSDGYKIVFDHGTSAVTDYRLMVTGVRSAVPTDLEYTGAIFDEVTAGNIRGHAAGSDALTVAGSELCADGEADAYSTCSTLSIARYSSDGEDAGTALFFWESDGAGGYTEITGGLAVTKPDLTAAGQSILTTVSSGTTSASNYYGTSASAAATAGIAALYWEYAETTLGINADFVAEAVRDLLANAVLDAGETGTDILFGTGILDAPKPIEDGVGTSVPARPRVSVALGAKAAGAALQFSAALPALAGATYTATCTDGGAAITVWTDKAVSPVTAYAVQANPEADVVCTVTGSIDDGAGGTLTETDTATVTASVVSETTVSFSSDIDQVSVIWSTDATIADENMLVVTLTCANASSGATVVNNVELDQSPYVVEAEDGEALDCSVTTSLSVNGGAAATVGDPATEAVTPDMASGLPIWLLYQATQ